MEDLASTYSRDLHTVILWGCNADILDNGIHIYIYIYTYLYIYNVTLVIWVCPAYITDIISLGLSEYLRGTPKQIQ